MFSLVAIRTHFYIRSLLGVTVSMVCMDNKCFKRTNWYVGKFPSILGTGLWGAILEI